jgi:hypothetical protein
MAKELTPFETRVGVRVRSIAAGAKVSTSSMAEATGLGAESVRRRLRGELPWSLAELEQISPLAGVDPGDFTAK